MRIYFVLSVVKETRQDTTILLDSLIGTKTVEDESNLLTTGNSLLAPVTVKFAENILSGSSVKNATGLYYTDVDTGAVFGPSLVFVPIDTEWWAKNRVWPGIEFESDRPYPRILANTPEEIAEGRWYNASITGNTWEELRVKVAKARGENKENVTLTQLEEDVYDTWS